MADNLPVPSCAPHEVLVRVHAAAVNPLDCRIREGYGAPVYRGMLPLVLGRDVSGEVVATGSSARAFPVGAQVFGALSPVSPNGTHAEYVAVSEAHLARKPECLTHEEASAIPFAALTAWRALFASGGEELRAGERVLIMGGGSSVGTAAAQLALAKGCQVAATCGPRSHARLAALGVTQLADYTAGKAGALSRVARDEGWAPFDVALDTVGSRQSERSAIGLLRKGVGRYVTLHGQLAGLVGERGIVAGGAAAGFELMRKKMLHRASDDVGYHWAVMRQDSDAMAEIGRLARRGALEVALGWTLPLEEAARAHELTEDTSVGGKVVLTPRHSSSF